MLSANQIAGFFKMQYLKKKVNDELHFWHADKHLSILQVNTVLLVACDQACPSTQNKFGYIFNISRIAWWIS